jgi:hypothetical protein
VRSFIVSDSKPAARSRKSKDDGVTDPTSDETLVTENASETVADPSVVDASEVDASESDNAAVDAPVAEAPVAAPLIEPAAEPVVVEPVVAEPLAPAADEAVAPVVAEPVVATTAVAAEPQAGPHVVYIEAPQAPRKKGNRAIGSLIALASAVLFALLYAVILFLVELGIAGSANFEFLSQGGFWAPVVVFAVGFVILVVIVNRAGWAAYVVGSLAVGVFVYFGTSAAILLINAGILQQSQVGEFFHAALINPAIIIAGLLAREVSLWVGFAIAARGRRVRARNVEAREAYDREFAAKRAEYDRANAARMDAARADASAPVDASAEA